MTVALVVIGIVVFVALIQAAIWIPLIVRWRRRSAAYWAELEQSLPGRGEELVLPVQPGMYRGGTGSFSQVRGNARLALTTQRLVCRKATGGVVEVPTAQITGTRRAKAYNGAIVASHVHLIVELADGTETAYFVTDIDLWERQIAALHR